MKLRRAWALVYDRYGNSEMVDFLDANGCTETLTTLDSPFDIYVYPWYESTSTQFTFWVEDCEGGSCVVPVTTLLDVASTSSTTTVTLPVSPPFSIYNAVAFGLSRLLPGFYGSGWHEFVIYYDPGEGNRTLWDDTNDRPYVVLGTSGAWDSKYKPLHEVGHVLMLDAIQTSDPADTLDCSYGPGNPDNHTVMGQEYNSCASFEGFGHFVAAATWNEMGDNADGYWMDWGGDGMDLFSGYLRYNIESGFKEILAHCSGDACCGFGTEMDWARTFWDFRTDSGTPKPNEMDPLSVWEHAFPYDLDVLECGEGHYADIKQSTGTVLGSTLEARFHADAQFNGANY